MASLNLLLTHLSSAEDATAGCTTPVEALQRQSRIPLPAGHALHSPVCGLCAGLNYADSSGFLKIRLLVLFLTKWRIKILLVNVA